MENKVYSSSLWPKALYFIFSLLDDPQYEGSKKSQAVWAVCAVEVIPNNRPIGNEEIIQMDMQKGKFD